jgi:hypothetical protein
MVKRSTLITDTDQRPGRGPRSTAGPWTGGVQQNTPQSAGDFARGHGSRTLAGPMSPLPGLRCLSGRLASLPCALLALLLAGCPSSPPTVNVPVPRATAAQDAPKVTRPAGPIVLFTMLDGVLAPIVCHDGKKALPSDSDECLDLVPEGAKVVLEGGAAVTIGPRAEAPCRGSQLNKFQGRKALSTTDSALYAIWPESAAGVMVRPKEKLEATGKEKAALSALLQRESEGMFTAPPELQITGGLSADIDGDGALDRAFSAYNEPWMMGLVAVFLAQAPAQPLPLSVLAHDYPRLGGVTEIDGRPGYELWVTSAFVEGIEDQTVTSALSERVVFLRYAGGEELGSWGCRIF